MDWTLERLRERRDFLLGLYQDAACPADDVGLFLVFDEIGWINEELERRASAEPPLASSSLTETAPMNRLRQTFANRHVILPVIHVTTQGQALRNASIARGAGADGVFLINHVINSGALLTIHQAVKEAHPGWWVGVNCLGMSPEEVFARISPRVDGVWVDNARIDEASAAQPRAQAIAEARARHGWQGLYFGGVAFKYQREVADVGEAAKKARGYMDVVTTSGAGTGEAAPVEKLRAMRAALGDFPLALASGVTPDNVRAFLPYADAVLVATGISSSFEELDPAKAGALVRIVRSYRSAK